MGVILHDLSPASLVAALEQNLYFWIPIFGQLGRAYLDDPPGVKRSVTALPLALFNSVMDARLAPEEVDPAIGRVLSDARSRRVPVLWWITPSTRPPDLGRRLEQHGFMLEDEAPGMAVELALLDETLPAPEGLTVRHAQDDASWRTWAYTMALGFGAPAERAARVTDAWHNLLCRADPATVRAYTAWWHDQPVATSLLALGGGVAGIYAVATIPEARRRGIGAQVTLHPLLEARAAGYRAGVLGASQMGVGVYRSLGFRQICTQAMYRWQPGS